MGLLVSGLLLLTSSVTIFANELPTYSVPMKTVSKDAISKDLIMVSYGSGVASSSKDLSSANYSYSVTKLSKGDKVFTEYNFTGVTGMKITVSALKLVDDYGNTQAGTPTSSVTIEVFEKGSGILGSDIGGKLIASATINSGGGSTSFSNQLSASKEYYVVFSGTSQKVGFSGVISKN